MAGTRSNKKGFWNSLPPAGKVFVLVGGTGLTLYVSSQAYGWYKQYEAKKRLKERGKHICEDVDLSAVAYNIWDAMWNYMGGYAEDEETAVNELLKVPKSCVPELAQIYYDQFEKNLYEDFRTYVEGEQYEQVRALLEENPKARAIRDFRRLCVYDRLYTPYQSVA